MDKLLIILFFVCLTSAADRPNVVFILSDDQAWDDYGFMGSQTAKTPHLDKLASESLVFKRGYVTSPLCRPSLASMVTGLHPHRHGVTGNDVDGNKNRAVLDIPVRKQFHTNPSMIRKLTESGYMTHQSGKWWEGSAADGGFTEGMTHGDPKRGGRHGDTGLKIGRTGIKPVTEFIDKALDRKKPFFIWYAPFLPHTPHNPPKRLLAKYGHIKKDAARYYAMIEWFDETCGDLLGHLNKKGIAENTLVVYICDNGWKAPSQADMKLPKGWPFSFGPRSKGSPFENGIRTPIMFKLPGKIKPFAAEDLASAVDLYPTILKACGISVEDGLPGIDLLNEPLRKTRKEIYGASYSIHNMSVGNPADTRQYRWIITQKWKYLVRDNGVDTTKYKFVHQWDEIHERLYDLVSDPHEKENVAGKNKEVVKELKSKVNAWLK